MSLPHCWQESVLGRPLSPLCPPSTTAQIEDSHPAEKPQHLRTCVPWVTSHPQSPPPIPPPHILALTRDFSTSPEGSNASQVSCAELVPSSSMKPRAQRAFLPQQPILRLVAGFPSAQVTSAGPGEEVKGVKGEEGRWPGWGLRAAGPKDFACFWLGPPHRVPGILCPHPAPAPWAMAGPQVIFSPPCNSGDEGGCKLDSSARMAGQREEGAPAETWPGGACHSSLTSTLLLPRAGLGWAGLLLTGCSQHCW